MQTLGSHMLCQPHRITYRLLVHLFSSTYLMCYRSGVKAKGMYVCYRTALRNQMS